MDRPGTILNELKILYEEVIQGIIEGMGEFPSFCHKKMRLERKETVPNVATVCRSRSDMNFD